MNRRMVFKIFRQYKKAAAIKPNKWITLGFTLGIRAFKGHKKDCENSETPVFG